MNLNDRIRSILNKPFPINDNRASYLRDTIIISLFITFFLFVFRPFGLSLMNKGVFWICLGFGCVTFFSIWFYELTTRVLFKRFRNEKNFTFSKWIVTMIGLLLLISVVNFSYARFYIGYFEWGALPQMILATVSVGIFPTVFIGGISLLKQERKYQNISSEINDQIEVEQKTGKEHAGVFFGIDTGKIRYVEALQNYVKIGYVNDEGVLKELVERSTLSAAADVLSGTGIVKCHRSFLVNKNEIIQTTGNAQGLTLELSDCKNEIPVSRSFVSQFRK